MARVNVKGIDQVYARPRTDLSLYNKVLLDPIEVSFRKDWDPKPGGLLQLTDWELLRTSPVPVLLVKSAAHYKRPAVLAAVDPLHALSKPATLDREILSIATRISRAMGGSLHVVQAYVPMPQEQVRHRLVRDDSLKKLTLQTEGAARRRFYRSVQSAHIPKARCQLIGRHPIDALVNGG